MTRIPAILRRVVAAALVTLLAFGAFAPGAGAAEATRTDPAGDVPYARGDITQVRVIHRSANVDLRVRTRVGGQPVNNWPNRQSYIRWLLNTDGDPAFDYIADLRLVLGEDTVFVGRVLLVGGGAPPKGCEAIQFANTPQTLISAVGNEYRFQFLRGCIGAPTEFRARATLRWDNGNPNVGPVHTDRAPNAGTIGPVVSGGGGRTRPGWPSAELTRRDRPRPLGAGRVRRGPPGLDQARHTGEMRRPRIGMTPWRRMLPTFLAARTDLYTLGTEYAASIAAAGGLPLILPHLDPERADEVLHGLDGLVLCGGDDVDPITYGAVDQGGNHLAPAGTDGWELALAGRAVEGGIPVLGICRGLQVLNVAFGGTLRQHIAVEGSPHPPTPGDPEAVLAQRHRIAIAPGSRLATVYGVDERVVNTIHHQAVDRLGEGLEAVAWAPDGLIEAVEAVDPALEVLAVQWHPEKMPDDSERPLFEDFVVRVAARTTAEDGVTPGR